MQSVLGKGPSMPTTDQISWVQYHTGHQSLELECKQAVCSIPRANTKRKTSEFLRVASFYQIWIRGYLALAKLLFEAVRDQKMTPYTGELNRNMLFTRLKQQLTTALVLGLPDVSRTFNFFVAEINKTVLGGLTQEFRPWKGPVAYYQNN